MTMLKPVTRLVVSICVVVLFSVLVFPHFMDVDPPSYIRILLKPAELVDGAISPLIPHPNIGTPENPIYEGTPIDLLVGLILVLGTIVLYGVVTYLLLTFLAYVMHHFRNLLQKP
jgi:hypothetical protein